MTTSPRPRYSEKLLPSPWVFVATGLVIPASILVFAPISLLAGVAVAIGLFAACVAVLIALSPTITVDDEFFRIGPASIELEFVGEPVGFEGAEAFAERGTRLDARAYLVIRGWVPSVVRLPIEDDSDPVPYWLVSTRRPNDVVAAIRGSRRREVGSAETLD